LRRVASKNHRTTAAQVTEELNIHLEYSVSTKTVQHELHRSNIHSRAAITKPLKVMLRCINNGVVTIKPGHQTTGNAHVIWSDELSPYSSLLQEQFTLGEHPMKPTIWYARFGSNSETRGRFFGGLGSNILVQILLVPLLPFMVKLLQANIWTCWVIRCIP
jgi:hypothetical protein